MTLRNKVLSSLKWVAAARFLTQLIRWSITFIVIRLLQPEDYALVSLSDITLSFLMLFSTLGVGQAIIRNTVSHRQFSELFGFLIIMNISLFIIQLSLAPFSARFFEDARIEFLMSVMAFGFLITLFEVIPNAKLAKEFKFKALSIIDFVSGTIAALTTLALAYMGYGYWSLIFGELTLIMVRTCAKVYLEPSFYRPKFTFTHSKHLISYGGMLALGSILWFLYISIDKMIGGKLLDKDSLGLYVIMLTLASIPMTKAMPLIQQVAFPAYSEIKHNLQQVQSYVLKTIRFGSFLCFPIFFGMAAIAGEIIPLLLGERFNDAAKLLIPISLALPLRILFDLFSPAIKAVATPKYVLLTTGINLLIMSIAFAIGSQYGVSGLANAWAIGFPISFIINNFIYAYALSINVVNIWLSLIRPLVINSLILSICLLVQNSSMFAELHFLTRLAVIFLLYGGLFFLLVYVFDKVGISELFNFLRKKSNA